MAETDISILVRVRDEASAAMQKLGGSIESLQPAFKTMAVAGTAALGTLGAIAYKTISDYSGAEAAAKQLEHATLSVAKGTREQLKALQDLSTELERKGVLDGDAISTGLAQLQTFGLSTDMVTKLGKSMADLAVNQFGVNATSEQLTQTANIMAKALNGQFGVLEKGGIRFTDAQKRMIQFGTETERVKAMQEGLAQNLKYTNEVASQTVEGSMAKLQVQLGNISENIGSALVPALNKLMKEIMPIVEKVVTWTSENPKLVVTVLAVAAGLATLVTVIGAIGLAIPAVVSGITAIGTALTFLAANPIGITIMAIGALVVGIAYLVTHWEQAKQKAIEVWQSIPDVVKVAAAVIAFPITSIIGLIVLLTTHWETIKAVTIATWEAIKSVIQTSWEIIKQVFEIYVALTVGIFVMAFQKMGIDIVAVMTQLVVFFQQAWEFIKKIFTTSSKALGEAWFAFWESIKEFTNAVWENIKAILQGAWGWILDGLNAFVAPFNAVFGGMWESAQNIVISAWNGIKATVLSGLNWVIEKINGFINQVNSAASKAAGAFGFSAPQIPNIPKLANGGIVTKPTIAMIGEAGAEAVVPLTRGNLAGAGIGGVTVNLYGDFYTEQENAIKYGDLLANEIKRIIRV